MKRIASIFAAILTIASLATVRSAFGANIATVVSNATDVTVNSDTLASGEALYVYTQTGTEFKFNLSNQSKAWILVVGGGGAGGAGATATVQGTNGSGGGGGAGGLIEQNGISLAPGAYTITVGAGGAAVSSGNGKDGSSSSIISSGFQCIAKGGGGGAAAATGAGNPGGSGGGSSYVADGDPIAGGTAEAGQGNAGGEGAAAGGGAGGGGAGGVGGSVTTSKSGYGGAGGAGKASAITGTTVTYAPGGGGGANTNGQQGLGGLGDNSGKGGARNSANRATAGTDGIGGGGGGGSVDNTRKSAKGGSGIVIIRVMKIYGEIDPPVAKDFEYTGGSQNIWPDYDPSDCDLTDDSDSLTQTAVGTYKFTVTPKDGSCWKGMGGSSDPLTITWHIVKASNSLTVVQDGWIVGSPVDPVVSYKVTDDPSGPTIEYSTTEGGEYTTTVPTDPGVYWVRASIAETGNYDGATAGPVSFRILGASESPNTNLGFYAPITFPNYTGSGSALIKFTLQPSFQYHTEDNETSSLCVCSANGQVYPQTVEWSSAGAATITVEIDNMSSAKQVFLCWGLVEGGTAPTLEPPSSATELSLSPTHGDIVRDTSKTLQNYIKDLAMPSWCVGETPSTPEYKYKIGTPIVKYIDSSSNESSVRPTEPGTYTLSVSIPEETGTDNGGPYSGVPATNVTFKIIGANESPMVDKSLKYFSAITASAAVSAGKVTVNVPSSHNWVASYNDGKDVRFCDIDGNVYRSALSAWNGDGSATFAVDVPAMSSGDKFYMCWGETVDKSAPATTAPSGASVTATFSVGNTVVDTSLTLKNWIRDLSMNGYRLGNPTVPTCVAKIGAVKYQYSKFQTTGFVDWDPSDSLDPGVYYMRAIIDPSTDEGYEGAVSESPVVTLKFRVLDQTESPLDALAWFAPVTATGTLTSPASVSVTLPNTFNYRTIYNDGSDIRFSDANGNVLPSTAASAWATDGTAKFNVQIPAFSSSYTFYVCWGPVVGVALPQKTGTSASAAAVIVNVGSAVRDETKQPLVNHWVSDPVFPSAWAVGDTMSYTAGDPAYGTFKLLLRDIADPTGELTVITELPDRAGDFELIACADAGEYWAGMTNAPFEVSVSKHDPSISLTLEHGAEGRVLLMNADVTPGAEIENQGYADNDPSYSTFWEHFDYDYDSIKGVTFQRLNLSNETASILWTSNKERRLWTLKHCRQGNFFRKDDSYNIASATAYNYLPWDSPNARDIDSHASTTHTRHGAGQIIMQNTTNAVVYSSCFEDGIGTIYFDAVNGGRITSSVKPEYFQLKVSYATDCITSLGEIVDIVPTDEYIRDFDETEPEPDAVITNANWRVVENVVPIKILNGAIADSLDQTDTITLDIGTGGSDKNFYRLRAKLDITKPVRFKIERVSDAGGNTDVLTSYILLDNIIVSYPAMRASITTYGEYDAEKTGKRVIGQQAALNEVFPSVGSDNVLARGKVSFYTNAGLPAESINTNDFITSARFNYRWRYLNQRFYHDGEFSTSDDGKFASVRLSKADNYTISTRPLDLPGLQGDIEYWYELVLGAPYYKYVDYSGLNVGVGDDYSEEITSFEARADERFSNLPSCGTNWFVRVREGASKFERMNIVTTETPANSGDPEVESIEMDLVGDHQWRGFVVITNKTERNLTFYIKGVNPQVDGEAEYDASGANDIKYYVRVPVVDITSSPFSGIMAVEGEEVGYEDAKLHYLANVASYVEFQFNDESKAISVTHADYQDFNTWFSSRCEDDGALKFYSSAHETNSTSIATKRYPAEASNKVIDTFALTPRTSDKWYEQFKLAGSQTLAGFPMNKPFASERTPNGWLAEQGMWVAQKWGMTNSTDFALQMEGCGRGAVTFNTTPVPAGLDTIEFSTRLAQFNEFKDVSFSWENIIQKNYTIAAQACFDTDPEFRNFSGEASVSLFTGYVPYTGGYEYRVTIYNVSEKWKTGSTEYQRACVRHAIYKWRANGGKLVDELLVEVLDHEAAAGGWFWTATNKTRADMVKQLPLGLNGTQYSGMYMSFSNANGRVYITAGVSTDQGAKENIGGNFKYTSKNFQQIGCEDTSPVTTFGTYGAIIKNCPGQVLYPRIYEGKTVPIPGSGATNIAGGKRWNAPVSLLAETGFKSENGKIGTRWALDPGRMEELSGDPWGLVAANVAQDIGVYTLPVGSTNKWTCLTNIAVSTFNNDPHVITLQSREKCQVMFKSAATSDDVRTDIVIDDIMLTQWCGQSGSSTNAVSSYGYADDFYYTGSWISNCVAKVEKKSITNHVALLAPRRAETAKSCIGIRSPYMYGLGAIIFEYCDADANAVLQLQRWTGALGNLYSHLEDAADASGWTTLTNWTFSAGEKSGWKSYYLGLRTPSNGVFRIVVPQNKVREAYAHGEYDPNWGAVTIKDVYCYDEPAFDLHSWWGWNFLTTGWNDGKGNKYAAIDDSTEGGVGVLNNTLDASTLKTGNANDYSMNDPFIQCPTFAGERNIGEIAFRARKYADSSPSYITVWGAKSGDMQKGASWTAITNVPIESVSYSRHTVKCAVDEEGFAAIRLGVAKVGGIMPDYTMDAAKAAALPDSPVRIVVDEIVVRERVKPDVGFKIDFVRPFRLGLSDRTAIENIASRDQQPLVGEQFGFQAEVEVTSLSDEVDLSHTPEVRLSFYPKAEPWGYANWKDAEGAVLDVVLEPAEGTNLVYRSMSTTPLSFAGPFESDPDLGYGIVQYYLTVKYWDKGGDSQTTGIDEKQWQMPAWYYGFDDPNEREGAKFSPFTVLDTVSPGRAWFNEINFSDENGSNAKQFIELCFPAGFDMTGWRIYRYDVRADSELLASLGLTTGVPSTKAATGGDPNFAFLSLTCPDAAHPDADAYWSGDAYQCGGTDSYGFQLIRPSGIVEQQVVVQSQIGTGRYSRNQLGTNVVAQLEKLVGGTWEFVSADTNAAVKSSGVFQNAGALPADWNEVMDMTPGRINGGQTIPPDWFLPPSGTNVWLSLSTFGEYVWVVDGEDRVTTKTLVVPQGATTNLVFETAPWYQLDALVRDATNDVTSAAARSAGTARTNVWTYAFREDSGNSATLVASARPDDDVLARGGLDPADPYVPAVMNWLLGGTANGDSFEGDEISTNSFYQGLAADSERVPLSLKERYWLDIDPTSDAWDLRGDMGEIGPSTTPVAGEVRRDRPNIWPERLTNRVYSVTLMISNKVDNTMRRPNRLQGLGGEKSDVVGARNWTSETFKITMSLIKPDGAPGIDVRSNYWPMATFVFDADSFGAPDGPHPFAARIEVADPMSKASPAYTYGWWKYPGSTYGYKWNLSHGTFMRDPDILKSTNTWDNTWEAYNDWD